MKGHKRWRAAAWRVTVFTGFDPATGKRVDAHATVRAPNNRAGAKLADAKLAEMIAAVEGGQLGAARSAPSSGGLTFAELASRWEHANRSRQVERTGEWVGWSPKTAKTHRDNFERYIFPKLAKVQAKRVSGFDLDDLYRALEDRGLSPAVVSRCHSQIRAMYNWGLRKKLVEVNPALSADPPKQKRSALQVPAMADIRRVQELAPASFAAYVQLAASVGARRGTLVALRWRDVDLEDGTIRFEHAAAESMDGQVEKGTKADRPYVVSIGSSTVEVLSAHRARQIEASLAVGASFGGDSYVFSDDGGTTAWNLSWPSHAWRRYADKGGLGGIRLHDLRHTAASQMLMAGVPLSVVAERLGCTEGNVLRTYRHFIPGADRGAADLMDRLLDGEAAC